MFAVIDCGTTNTRIYIVNKQDRIEAFNETNIGTRDTSITGSKEKLRNGIHELYQKILSEKGLERADVNFAIAAGMITSELGLIELPHLMAPAGLRELAEGVVKTEDGQVLSLGCPVYFIRGIKNRCCDIKDTASIDNLRFMDFMRGEEVQCMGILAEVPISVPCNIVVLSSHTKNIYINSKKQIGASCTTISGQLYDALLHATFLGSSFVPEKGEERRFEREDLVRVANECVSYAGLGRTFLMARFMQILMESHYEERDLFVNAAIAADDMNLFDEMRRQGFDSGNYCLVGHKNRCELYEYMLHLHFGESVATRTIFDKKEISWLTVAGDMAVAMQNIKEAKKR